MKFITCEDSFNFFEALDLDMVSDQPSSSSIPGTGAKRKAGNGVSNDKNHTSLLK